MEIITKYRANDGSEWDSEVKAAKRELLIAEVNAVMSLLPPVPTEPNWKGYIRHDKQTIRTVRQGLFFIDNREGILKWWYDQQKTDHGKTDKDFLECHPSWQCRMLDGSHRPLERAYGRLCCIDEYGREWNQPYFARNPPPDAREYTPTDVK